MADSLDGLLPPEMAVKAENLGTAKAALPAATTIMLAVLAGAFIALGAVLSTSVTADAAGTLPFGLTRLAAGVTFSLGLIAVTVGGAELFTGNNLIVMAWTSGKIPISPAGTRAPLCTVETIESTASVAEAKTRMKRQGIHHLVVQDRAQLLGVVSARDLAGTSSVTEVAALMSPKVVIAAPRDTIREAANLLRGRSIGCLPIVERGKVVAIVTISDLLELLGKGATRPVERSTRPT